MFARGAFALLDIFGTFTPLQAMRSPRANRLPLLTRGIAAAAALLVVALSLLASSPLLHAWLHGHGQAKEVEAMAACAHSSCPHSHEAPPSDGGDCDEICIVAQYAHGQASCGGEPLLLCVNECSTDFALPSGPIAPTRAPDSFLPPVCGPPAV